jgi:hypothetical protein
MKRKNEMIKISKLQQKQEQEKLRGEKLFKFMKNSEEIEAKKSIELIKRQEKIDNRKKLKDLEMRKTILEKAENHLNREEYIKKQKSQFDILKEEYDNRIKERLAKISDRIIQRKEIAYKECIDKFEKLEIRREDNLEKYQCNIKAVEYEREKRLDSILQRIQKIEEVK